MDCNQVCIIGAGSSGLTAAKTLRDRKIPFECIERGSGVGGLWRYGNDSGLSAAYQSLHINTSRDRMGFADYPMPRDYPDFPHHSLILKYFEDYTDHFGLRDSIEFQTTVLKVEPQTGGGFEVITEDRQGRRQTREYCAVLVANGHHWKPRFPQFSGTFTGESLHSHNYRNSETLAGKRVLVVGMGNSGCDIACESSRVAERVFLSTRRGAHIIPKYLFGKPLDKLVPRWIWQYVPFGIFQRCFEAALRVSRGRIEKFGLPKPEHRVLEEHPTISSDLLNLIGHGEIEIKPNVRELAERSVLFDDGSAEEIDVIVYATGYDVAIPFLDPQVLNTEDNEVRLYRHTVHPEYPGLYFIGLIQPWGAIMPLAEAQGKWIADLLEGACGLPAPEVMNAKITSDREKLRRRYTQTARHTIQVDYYPYLAELKRERRRKPQANPRGNWHPFFNVQKNDTPAVRVPLKKSA